jgi:hypothetical protein
MSDVYERVLARAPGLVPSDLILDLPILTHTSNLESLPTADSGFSAFLPVGLARVLRMFDDMNWPQAVELFHMFHSEGSNAAPAPAADKAEEPTTPSAPGIRNDGSREQSSLGGTTESLVYGLAAAAGVVTVGAYGRPRKDLSGSRLKWKRSGRNHGQ